MNDNKPSRFNFRAYNKDDDPNRFIYASMNDNTLFEKREFYPLEFCVGFSHYKKSKWIIMQSTGLVDVNGVEIYESDIVRDVKGNEELVYWVKSMASFSITQSMIDNDGLTVIDNTYFRGNRDE